MKKFLLSICFLVLIISKVDAQACGTCSNADCSIVGPKTGSTAAADLTTEMQKPATISANAFYVDGDPILFKSGPYTFTNCYVVTITSSSQTLGLKLSSVITGTNPTYTGVLYKGNNSCSNLINPSRTNVAGGSSGFNPEWDGLAPGVYTYCLTVNIPAGSSMKSILMGYYLSGTTVTPSNTCSDCATAACDIAGPFADFATANSNSNQCAKIVDISSSPVQSPTSYTSYYKVSTSATATTLGIIISNGTGKIDGTSGNCPASTRVATLYAAGSNCSTGTVGSSTSNVTGFFNVEWSGLTSNTQYIVKVVTTPTTGCQIQDQCASYYSPGSVAPLPCGKVGIDWRNTVAQPKPTNTQLTTCIDKDFSIKANEISLANQYIAPGFELDEKIGDIKLTKLEIDEGGTGVYISIPVSSTIYKYCSPGTTYKLRLTGSVNSGGSGVVSIVDHATGNDLYVGSFTSGMVITLNPGTIKGTATYSGPGVSNYKLDAPTAGATTFLGSGYGVFNPKKAGNGTHTISYAWNNGNQDCGTATMTVTVSGCATPVCKVVDIDLYDDNQISTPHTGTSFNCNSNVVYLAPKDVVNKYLTTTEDPDFTWPFPMIRTEITATSGNMNNLLINYYDPVSGVLIESGNAIAVNTHYFARKEGYQITLDKTDNSSGTYNFTTYDVITGAVIVSGIITVTNGVESAKTVVMKPTNFNGSFSCSTCGSGSLLQGISPYIDELGLGTFDPKKAGAGTHILTYTWDNGLTGTNHCSGSKSITVTVTGGPTITPALSDVCVGAITTKLTYTSTGTPTKYSIDWNAAANTAGLNDVTDVALVASPVNVTIPGTLAAGTYTGSLIAKNASGCSSAAQTVTLKVNASPSIIGTTSICEGTTALDWKPTSGVTWSSSDALIASVSTGGTLSGYKAGTVTITATDNTTQCTATKQVTVNPKPTISGTLTVCEGSTTSLTGSGTAATTTSPWVSATTANASVSNTGVVTGVTGGNGTSEITYTDNKGCSVKSTVTVNPILFPTVTCGTSTATSVTFTWGAVTGATTYDIVYNINNTGDQTVTGHTTTTYSVPNVPAGKSVTIIVTPKGIGCFKASTIKTCTADNCPTPSITQEPTNLSKCDGSSASFSITATSTATLSYQWQINNGSGTPTNITNTGVYSGATSSTLSISDVKGLNGTKFQCLVTETSSGTGCNKTSVVATLTVNPIPSFAPSVSDICEGNDPALTYSNLTGNPDRIVLDPNLLSVSPFNIPVSTSPIVITGLPIKLPVNTYSGLKVRLENTVTGCKSSDITIASFKVQATQTPSISSKGTDVSSVTFQWSDLTGLNTQTGAKEDKYTVEEFICNGCNTPGVYSTASGVLSFNSTSSKWEYLKNNLQPGDRVFIKVTPVDISPLAIPSCYNFSVFDLTAVPCDAPVISKDIEDVTLCEGTSLLPVSASFDLEYNLANTTNPVTWEILTPGGSWTTLNLTGVYSVTGTTNTNTKLTISDIKGLDGVKFRVNLKTATVGGTCNTVSKEVLLTVKPLPTMVSVADKSFCPGTLVNDPSKPKDFDFKVTQSGSPTFTWKSDLQTTGVKLEGINTTDGTKNVSDFESFTTSSPSNDAVSVITVIPTLNQCVGQSISFKITVKPLIKPINFGIVQDFNNVKFTWSTSSVQPDFWSIDTAITSVSANQPSLAQYKSVQPQNAGSQLDFTVSGINSSKKAYINVTPKQDPTKTELFCPASDGYTGIPTPCVKPVKPSNPTASAVCEGSSLSVNGILADPSSDFQWKISTDAGVTWNDVSSADFGNTGKTTNLSTQVTKAYMNKALVKVVLTDKLTGQCSEESNTLQLVVNELPNVKLIQPSKTSLCIDDNDVSAFVQPLKGKTPLKVDYILNGVTSTNQDISNLEIKFSAKSEMNYSLSLTKVVDANSCESTLSGLISLVSVHKNPVPSFAVSDTIGCFPLKINFTDISGEKFSDVTWDFGTGTNSSIELGTTTFTYQKAGDYTVRYSVVNEYGCSGEIVKIDKIHVKNSPKALITTDRNMINVFENVVRFDSKLSQNGTFYKWDFGDNSSFSNEPIVNHKYDPSIPGKFKVYLIVSNSSTNVSCSDTAVTWIDFPEEVVYFIPNTFTPNGDEFNNTFQPVFTSGYDPQNYLFTIYDRWGQIVFETKNPTIGWDGTYGNKVLGNDTFVWKLGFKEKATDNEHHTTGHVNLVK